MTHRTPRTAAPLALGLLLLGAGGAGCASTPDADPWQPANRPVFGFNEGVDRYALEPVATGWDWVFPDPVQNSVNRFFENLAMPRTFLNDVLQGKPIAAAQDLGRFTVNSTAGVLGLFDVASRLDIPANVEDFGQTLGAWGLPEGPYMVLPLLGPSTVRDTLALPVDSVARIWPFFVGTAVGIGVSATEILNTRSLYLEEVRENRRTALDYYVFVRDAYLQYRRRLVRDAAEPEPEQKEDDLYYLDEEATDAPVPDPAEPGA